MFSKLLLTKHTCSPFQVTATDLVPRYNTNEVYNATATVEIFILDSNDNPPVFTIRKLFRQWN